MLEPSLTNGNPFASNTGLSSVLIAELGSEDLVALLLRATLLFFAGSAALFTTLDLVLMTSPGDVQCVFQEELEL